MQAVIYGAGNIGRGFIGQLLSQSGYHVTFIDIDDDIVTALSREHCYPVRIITSEGFEESPVLNVDAVHARDAQSATKVISAADIMATAVGANNLRLIAPMIAQGIKERFRSPGNPCPLNIILCENLLHADTILAAFIKEALTKEEKVLFDLYVGLVEASIGRMVPIQTPQMWAGNPLRVCVERYGYLPVDRDAFCGDPPHIPNMVPFSPFSYFIKRKLYIHNMGHALCAYLGLYSGLIYIWQTLEDPYIYIMTYSAMLESAQAIFAQYEIQIQDLHAHIHDLLQRFANAALCDTCLRVGRDPARKLAPTDRLVGAARECLSQGILPVFICIGLAAAVYARLEEKGTQQTESEAKDVLLETSSLAPDDPLIILTLPLYHRLLEKAPLVDLFRTAQALRAEKKFDVV